MSVERIPDDIYRQCVAIAKSYYTMLHRRSELESNILHGSSINDGMPRSTDIGDPTARKAERMALSAQRNNEKIRAVERAWARLADGTEREFVKRNMFEGTQMQYISLPMSIRTMKRVRSRFICLVAEELGGSINLWGSKSWHLFFKSRGKMSIVDIPEREPAYDIPLSRPGRRRPQ